MQKQIFKLLLLMIATSFSHKTFSQPTKGNFYVFKADWTPAKSIDDCTYFMHEIKKSDTEFICRYYNKFGPMVKQETYKDEALSIPNGRFCWYNEKGDIDSCGLVKNLKKDGRWDYFSGDSTAPTFYEEYDNGKFIKQSSRNLDDKIQNKKDSIQKAAFPDGNKGWIRFLTNNLIIPDRLKNTLGRGNYVETVCFLIDMQGKVHDVYLRKSVEWSADTEIFSIIQKSPTWFPATENGKPVYYRQIENITLAIN